MKLREEVQWFAKQMEITLRKNDYKDGWEGMPEEEMLERLKQETEELARTLDILPRTHTGLKTKRRMVLREAADVANFAMFIARTFGRQHA